MEVFLFSIALKIISAPPTGADFDMFIMEMKFFGGAKEGNLELVMEALQQGIDINRASTKDFTQKTALHMAAWKDHENIAQYLTEHGAGVNLIDLDEETPLHYTAEKGSKNIAKLLCTHGALSNITDKYKSMPIHYAAENDHPDVAKTFIDFCNADIHVLDEDDRTPLHRAAKFGHEKSVEFFINQGSNKDAKDFFGDTPLMIGAERGHLKVVQTLREHGATLDANDRSKLVGEINKKIEDLKKKSDKSTEELAKEKDLETILSLL